MGELTVTTSRASTRSSLYPVQPASAKANSTEYKHHCRQGCISQEEKIIQKWKRKDIFQEHKGIFQESFTNRRARTSLYCVVSEVLECISSHCCLLFLCMHCQCHVCTVLPQLQCVSAVKYYVKYCCQVLCYYG